jgi:hypothetical protein
MACGRDWDDAIISATTGTAFTGTDNASLVSETFSTSLYQVAENFGGTNVGLTVAKMNEARRIFEHNENDLDMDRPTMVIGSKQHADLRNQLQVVSTEFNEKPVLVEGRLKLDTWDDKQTGQKKSKLSVVGETCQFLNDGQPHGESAKPRPAAAARSAANAGSKLRAWCAWSARSYPASARRSAIAAPMRRQPPVTSASGRGQTPGAVIPGGAVSASCRCLRPPR